MAPTRIGEPLLQPPIGGEQEQTFTVGIEPACRVYIRDGDVLCQAAPAAARLRGELAQHPIGLMEEKRAQEAWRARHKFTTPIEISSNPRSIVTGGSIIRVSACGVVSER